MRFCCTSRFPVFASFSYAKAGGQPFFDESEERLLQKVNRCKVNYPSWFSADAKDLLSKLLVRDPAKRWSLPMVKRHVWYGNSISITRELGCSRFEEDPIDVAARTCAPPAIF